MTRTTRCHRVREMRRRWWGLKEGDEGRDRKPGSKPPSWYKRMRRAIRRAKERQALRVGREPERFKNDNEWAWN